MNRYRSLFCKIFFLFLYIGISFNYLVGANIFNKEQGEIVIIDSSGKVMSIKEYDQTTFKSTIEEILKGNSIEDYIDELREILNIGATESFDRIYSCPAIKALINKDEFESQFADMKANIAFKILPLGGGASILGNTIYLHVDYLKEILRNLVGNESVEITPDFVDSIKKDIYGNKLSLTDAIGHEIMHQGTGVMNGALLAECVIHCLTRMCFDSEWTTKDVSEENIWQGGNSYCKDVTDEQWDTFSKQAGFDPRKEMDGKDEGKCWCKEEPHPEKGCCKEDDPLCVDKKEYYPPKNYSNQKRFDNPDDNLSYASQSFLIENSILSTDFPIPLNKDFLSLNFYPDILIYNKFDYPDAPLLLNRFKQFNYFNDYLHDYFTNNHKVLLIPSGELTGDENSDIIKNALKRFVETGGVLFVLSQQYGECFEKLIPVPEGENLKAYGFREDQSCLKNSSYFSFSEMHPVFTSSTKELIDVGIDGYFSVYPSASTVLLRRRINNEPAILYYPYGQGYVVLASLFSDYAANRSMVSKAELKLIRDIITFCKAPNIPIPMYNLNLNHTPSINLNVSVTNTSEIEATKARLVAYTPDRDEIVYEREAPVTLNPGDTATIPVNFSLPALDYSQLGIGHVDYELYDSENNQVQILSESETGRFAAYKITESYTSYSKVDAWITTEKEELYFNETAVMTFHLRNNTDTERTIELKYSWNHEPNPIPLQTVTIPAQSKIELEFNIDTPSYSEYLGNMSSGALELMFRLWYGTQGDLEYKQALKGIRYKTASTQSAGVHILQERVPVGTTMSYSATVTNETETTLEDTGIDVTLEKLQWPDNRYVPITKIYETTHTFTQGETFTIQENYTPDSVETYQPCGMYRLHLAVRHPEGNIENYYGYFFYIDSNTSIQIEPDPALGLLPGTQVPVKVTLVKQSDVSITNGQYAIIIKTLDGQIVGRKEVGGIAIQGERTISFDETILFQPLVQAPYYYLSAEYSDETMQEPRSSNRRRYSCKYNAVLSTERTAYYYSETAAISLNIQGTGTFDIHFTCPAAGIDELRQVTIPSGTTQATEVVRVPIGNNLPYTVEAEVFSKEGYYSTFGGNLALQIPAIPLQIETNGIFGKVTAQSSEDTPLGFNVVMKALSGLEAPLTGQLKVSCMNMTDIRTATISPAEASVFAYSIPVPETVTAGIYRATVSFEQGGNVLVLKSFPVSLPGPELAVTEPEPLLNAGETFILTLENTGGKSGNYRWQAGITDTKGKILVEYDSGVEPLPITAGEKKDVTLEIPGEAASGDYILMQNALETGTGKQITRYSKLGVTGAAVTLNAYTLKDTYFSNETLSGKVEITSSGTALEGASVTTGVVRYVQSSGITEQKPGDFISFNLIETGYSYGNTLYMVTDKGVISYTPQSGQMEMLYSFSENDGFNSRDIMQTAAGQLLIATDYGIYRQTSDNQWEHLTQADGIPDDWVYDILEATNVSGNPDTQIWVATYGGVGVNRTGEWQIFTTADGLPSNIVYRLAQDGSGNVWASTSKGLVKFDGTSFVSAGAPFGTTSISERMTTTADGNLWAATSTALYCWQPTTATWSQWALTSLYTAAAVTIHDMETINGELWLKTRVRDADYNQFNVLIKNDGAFTVYTEIETPGLTGLKYSALIPGSSGSNETVNVLCEVGMMAYDGATWTPSVIDIDSHKLSGPINCLKKDHLGRLWAGTEYGYSVNDGTLSGQNTWTNYCTTIGNQLLMDISIMDIDDQNRIYGYSATMGGIVRLADGNTELIEFPYDMGYWPQSSDQMTVEAGGRIWLGSSDLYYFETGGVWQKLPGIRYVKCMAQDSQDGIWVGAWNDYSQFHLIHIKNDLTIIDHTSADTGLMAAEIDKLTSDATGTLWIKQKVSNWGDQRELQSYDGENWTSYSNYDGYPELGAEDFTTDEAGNLHIVEPNGALYTLNENRFVLEMEQTHYSHSLVWWQGNLHCVGSLDGGGGGNEVPSAPTLGTMLSSSPSYFNLITLSTASGLGEQDLWSKVQTIDLTSGTETSLDIVIGQLPDAAPGAYVFKTRLYNANGQELGQSNYPFIVRETGISITLNGTVVSTDGTTGTLGEPVIDYVRAGDVLEFTLETMNNTDETKEELYLTVKQMSPGGEETEILNQSLTLAPGVTVSHLMQFNENEIGTWRYTAEITEGGVILAAMERVFEILQPNIAVEVINPEYAGDEAFNINVKLTNTGKISSRLEIKETVTGNTREIMLKPGAQILLEFTDVITADKTYQFVFSGDLEKTENITVKYGYVEQFHLSEQPVYREGETAITYEIANNGSKPFTTNILFKLYMLGESEPFLTTSRIYNLYPGEAPETGVLPLALSPGNYMLKYSSTRTPEKEMAIQVIPSGSGEILLTQPLKYPLGSNGIGYRITNIDTAQGNIPVRIVITKDENPLVQSEREYYIPAGESREDEINVEFTTPGIYMLSITGTKLTNPVSQSLQVVQQQDITATLEIGQTTGSNVPVTVSITNNGYNDFNGQVVVEVNGKINQEPVNVKSGEYVSGTYGIDTGVLETGEKEVNAYLYDNIGNIVTEGTAVIAVNGPGIRVEEVPENLEIAAGAYGGVSIKLMNFGNQTGIARLRLSAFDNFYREMEIQMAAGQELRIPEMELAIQSDIPTGNYPVNYILEGSGVENGRQAGNFNVKVNGIALQVDAGLDRSLYNPGETATFTINIAPVTTIETVPLEAIVNWGEFSETQSFTLSSGGTSLTFNIPLDEARKEKVFYGIYHEGGKGIHLNDIYLNFRGEISVEPDKQVYAPGEILHALFTADQGETAGVLNVTAFEESYSIPISSTASADIQIPQTALGGTYGIRWEFVPTNINQPTLSGSQPFDVSGLVVKTARSQLEKGKYTPGEAINAHYIFESNLDQVLELRSWVSTPSGDWTYLGKNTVTVTAAGQVDTLTSYSFTTTEAGTHEMIYGLYMPTAENVQLVVSGRNSFDVGDAVLLGISCDQTQYKTGNEAVRLRIDYFGQGTAQLSVILDEESLGQQGITLNGTGSSELIIDSARLSGGTHTLYVTLTQNGLTSTKTATFLYGTELPDLTVSLMETVQDGMNYTYKLEVENTGRTTAAATTLTFSDNGAAAGTVNIPTLQPYSTHEVTFNWSGIAKAGIHSLRFEIDSDNTVKEYSEENNVLEISEDVPMFFYDLVMEQFHYPANTAINLVTRLVNNREIPLQLLLEMTVVNEETGAIIYTRTKEEQLSALGSTDLTETFDTALNPAGSYMLKQYVTGTDVRLSKEIFFNIEPTQTITATIQAEPQQIPANTPTEIQLNLTVKNAGNVALEDEPLKIEVFNTDTSFADQSQEMNVSIPYGEEIEVDKVLALNLSEGNYEIRLKQDIEIIALVEFSVIETLKPSTTIKVNPRLLLLLPPAAKILFEKRVLDSHKHFVNKKSSSFQFLADILQSQNIPYETAFGPVESYIEFHKGQSNINVISDNEMGKYFRDELQERVFHGEGLILICDKPAQNKEWEDFLGMRIKSLPGRDKEKNLQILPSEFSTEGYCQTIDRIELQLEKKADNVHVIAQTQHRKIPVMAVRQYGSGHILVITLPLNFSTGADKMEKLLLKAIELFNTDVYSKTPMTRILPIETTIENKSNKEKQVTVKHVLSFGVEEFDYEPKPQEGEEIQWELTIPGTSRSIISSWLKLPDQVNTFEIKIQLFDGDRLLVEEIQTLEVTSTVMSTLNELILELHTLEANKEDGQSIRKTVKHLEKVSRRPGSSLMDHLLNLHDLVQAAACLEEVKHTDVTTQRYTCDELIIIMGRRLYETINTLGQHLFEPLMYMLDEARD